MALFHTTVLDNQIKALPTVSTASGSVATFDTDMTENLVEVKCQIVATQSGSGTPSPSNPRPITTYTSLNLSHSGADTSNPTVYNIPFGQTVANGVLDVTTGKLTDTLLKIDKTDFPSMNVSFNSEVGIIRSFYLSLPLGTRKVDNFVMSNKFASQPLSGDHAYDCEVATSGGAYTVQRIYFSISNVDYPSITAEQAKQFLIDNDIEFYITRYSNVVTQLDSITLQALLNENNVWCDTGDTEVKYLLTVGKKIS